MHAASTRRKVTQEQLQGLAALRAELDRIDDEILDLIERRLAASADIAAQKDAEGDRNLKVRPKRQAQILERLKARAGSARPELVSEIWRELMGASLQAQARTELVLAPSDQPELLEARVRAHFGSAPPIRWAASTAHAIRRPDQRPALNDRTQRHANDRGQPPRYR